MAEFRVVVKTSSFDESRRFYGDGLGWPLQRDWPPPGQGAIYVASGEAVIELLDEPDAPRVTGAFCSVEVADVTACAAAIEANGVTLTAPPSHKPWGHLSFEVTDPNGLGVVFYEVV